MKIAVLGDIHGNLIALEKFLAIEKGNYDALVCHGDVVNYGPWSNECVQLLNTIENTTILKGNHEEAFINKQYPGSHPIAKAFYDFNINYFTNENRIIISKYGENLILENFEIAHTINNKYWFQDSDFSELTLNENLIIGHSHQQFEHKFKNGKSLFNTGSLGQNRSFINIANYLILDTDKQVVEMKSFLFDIDVLINEFRARIYPQICIDYYNNKNRI